MWNQKPSFRFEIDNFLEKKVVIASQVFEAGGCKWYLRVHPKGCRLADDHLSLYLYVAKDSTLRTGWKRHVGFYFSVLNHSDKELCRSNLVRSKVLNAKETNSGFRKLFPLSKLQRNGFLEKDRLIIEVYIRVIEAVDDGKSEGVPEEKETVDINGFQVFASQAAPVRKIFAEHPDITVGFKPKNQVVKTAYINVLLGLIKTLEKPPQNHTETGIINAQSELSELKEVGFKLDWLKSKLEEVILERKKTDAYGSKVQQLEERVKNLEQMENNMGSLKRKMVEDFFESKKARADPRVQKLEKRVKNLEVIESGFRMDCLKSKLEDVTLEKKKDVADGSRVQQLEESVKNLEMMVSDLKKKANEENAKSSSDGFVVVDEVS